MDVNLPQIWEEWKTKNSLVGGLLESLSATVKVPLSDQQAQEAIKAADDVDRVADAAVVRANEAIEAANALKAVAAVVRTSGQNKVAKFSDMTQLAVAAVQFADQFEDVITGHDEDKPTT